MGIVLVSSLGCGSRTTRVEAREEAGEQDPNSACAPCHREIYDRYRHTPMAVASGPADEGFMPGEFTHPASGVHYRIFEEGSRVWLSYERDSTTPSRELNGRQQLQYFIGSGKRGRTFLFEQRGYWFEAPINWYGKKQVWDMAPNFQASQEMPLTLPVDPGCLHCHASEVSRSLPEARNLYPGEPFQHGGVTCSACHGDAAAHLASAGKTPMMKIEALEPVRRDSVCLNCHLEGQTAVIREGHRMEDFVPGENLFDFAAYFAYRGENGSGGRATSQWEALLKSECRKKSGDRMTCTTCHDPHSDPPPREKISYYRKKCLECHDQAGFEQKHHADNPDCVECHMAHTASSDIAHEQVTDHWIRRRISTAREVDTSQGELVPIGPTGSDDRDLGLAYAQMAVRGNREAGERALFLLKRAEHDAGKGDRDHELHANLGFLEQLNRQPAAAAEEYQMALAADPNDALAAADLALIKASEHRYGEALELLKGVFERDPAEKRAGMNLAIVECAVGERNEAGATLKRLLEFSPDEPKARELIEAIASGRQKCGPR